MNLQELNNNKMTLFKKKKDVFQTEVIESDYEQAFGLKVCKFLNEVAEQKRLIISITHSGHNDGIRNRYVALIIYK